MTQNKKKIIYLIGGAGLIGQSILTKLMNENHKIVVLDNKKFYIKTSIILKKLIQRKFL